jgi:glucose/arabinose dehydrogenase
VAKLVRLEKIAASADRPVFLAAAPGDRSGRLFLVEQKGTIRILRAGAAAPEPTPFLDLTARSTPVKSRNSEQGLLGLAFHPTYAQSGRFFVNFTDREGDTRVVEFRRMAGDPDRADPASEREVLEIDQPYANHNGGHLLFGPDGKLWVGTGDGGSANDPRRNGQNKTALLGKMLRLDVEREKPTAEIVAIGLRNPWRYDFDPDTGDLFIADVGQNEFEEIDVAPAGRLIGHNFGWNVLEGLHCFPPGSRDCDRSGMTDPSSNTRTTKAAPSRAASSTAARRSPSSTARTSTRTTARPSSVASAGGMAAWPITGTGRPRSIRTPSWRR